jgi:hypothetical protein
MEERDAAGCRRLPSGDASTCAWARQHIVRRLNGKENGRAQQTRNCLASGLGALK